MSLTVLVIEDDPTVLMFVEEGLEEQGFEVISARNGGEALNILGGGLAPVDALVADIRIGEGLDGWEIARCAREITPSLPIVYVTGDSAFAWEDEGVPNSLLLQKPFSRLDLAGAINTLLGHAHTGAATTTRPD